MTELIKNPKRVSDISIGDYFISPFSMKDPEGYPEPSRISEILPTNWVDKVEIRLENGKIFYLDLAMIVIMGELA